VIAVAFVVLAGVGAVARGVIGQRLNGHDGFPVGTLVVNLVGSFALGLLHGVDAPTYTVVGTGMIGAFTTFSSFARDTAALTVLGRPRLAALYVVASVGGALMAAAGGLALAA